jgi:hypothetical protein
MRKALSVIKDILTILFIFCILAGAAYAVYIRYGQSDEGKREITKEEIISVLNPISEIYTYEDEYTQMRSVDDHRFSEDSMIPQIINNLTKNNVTLMADGVVKVGYDFSDIQVRTDDEDGVIYVTIPTAKVTENYIKCNTVKCYETNNILNPIEFEQYSEIIDEMMVNGLKDAEENGIYEKADKNLEILIKGFLSGFEEEGYSIEFETGESGTL